MTASRGNRRRLPVTLLTAAAALSSLQLAIAPGCTDPQADNPAAPTVLVDDESCSYSCATLRTHAQSAGLPAIAGGNCWIYNGSWAGGLVARAEADPDSSCPSAASNIGIAAGEAWVVVGRPLNGAPRLAKAGPVVGPSGPSPGVQVFPFRVLVSGAGAGLALRYVHMRRCASTCVDDGSCSYDCATSTCAFGLGGYITAEDGAAVVVEAVFFDGANAATASGGAIYAARQASLTVLQSTFAGLQSTLGGGVFADASTVAISQSGFSGCVSNAGGGGVYAASCSLHLADVAFTDDPSGGDIATSALQIVTKNAEIDPPQPGDPVQSTRLLSTTFSPWDASRTVADNSSWLATSGGCESSPCQPGFSCSYTQFSLQCTPCATGTYSDSGLSCGKCRPSEEPNTDRSACQTCRPGTFSNEGTECKHCGDTNIRPDAMTCHRCSAGQGANTNRTSCAACAAGRYSTDGVCRDCTAPTVSHAGRTRCVLCDPGKEPDPAAVRDESTCR